MSTRLHGDVYVNGVLRAKMMVPPAGTITDVMVAPGARLDPTKLRHEHRKTYATGSATTAASTAQAIHAVGGAVAEVKSFRAGIIVPAVGNATVEIDLLKNGVTILDDPIEITSAHAAYQLVEAVVADDELEADDVLEVSVTAAVGTGTLPKGVFASLSIHEDA